MTRILEIRFDTIWNWSFIGKNDLITTTTMKKTSTTIKQYTQTPGVWYISEAVKKLKANPTKPQCIEFSNNQYHHYRNFWLQALKRDPKHAFVHVIDWHEYSRFVVNHPSSKARNEFSKSELEIEISAAYPLGCPTCAYVEHDCFDDDTNTVQFNCATFKSILNERKADLKRGDIIWPSFVRYDTYNHYFSDGTTVVYNKDGVPSSFLVPTEFHITYWKFPSCNPYLSTNRWYTFDVKAIEGKLDFKIVHSNADGIFALNKKQYHDPVAHTQVKVRSETFHIFAVDTSNGSALRPFDIQKKCDMFLKNGEFRTEAPYGTFGCVYSDYLTNTLKLKQDTWDHVIFI